MQFALQANKAGHTSASCGEVRCDPGSAVLTEGLSPMNVPCWCCFLVPGLPCPRVPQFPGLVGFWRRWARCGGGRCRSRLRSGCSGASGAAFLCELLLLPRCLWDGAVGGGVKCSGCRCAVGHGQLGAGAARGSACPAAPRGILPGGAWVPVTAVQVRCAH